MKPFHSKILACLLAIMGILQETGFSQIGEGKNAPNFQAKIIGSSVDFIFSGNLQKPIVIFFWDDSAEEIEDLKGLDNFAKENSGTFQAVSVFYGSESKSTEIESILREESISLATLLTNTEFEEQYQVDQTPTIIVIGTNNRIVLSKAGSRLTSEVFDLIKTLYSGTLTITCNQNNAEVYLNNSYVGMISIGSFKLQNLKPGIYQLRVRKSDQYTTFSQSVSITSGKNMIVSASLSYISPPKGTLVVTSNQEGAEVFLDGILQGRISAQGNLIVPNLNAGTYRLKVQGSSGGDISYQSVKIDNGQNTTINVAFSPKRSPHYTSQTPRVKGEKRARPIGSYLGFFAGYTIPMGNLKDVFSGQQPVNLGTRIRLMSKRAFAWELSGNYYQFKNNGSAYQLTQNIIPITLNMSVGTKYFYLTGGGGYYFSKYTFTSSFTGKVVEKSNRWGINTGVGIGFSFFEIGARYHYIFDDAGINASSRNFLDLYGGITPIYQKEIPYVAENRQQGLTFTYSYFPASAVINPNYVTITRETTKSIDFAKLYRISYMVLDESAVGIDFGAGHLPLGDIKFPMEVDMNLFIRLPLAPNRLELNFGTGGGILLLFGQRYAQPPNKLDNRFESMGSTELATSFWGQGFVGLRFSPFKKISVWVDGGYTFFAEISDWTYKKNDQSERLDLNQEWLQYQNIKLGGKCVRVGTLLGF